MYLNKGIPVFVLLSLFILGLKSQPTIQLDSFASGFSSPIGIEHCGDGRLFVMQQRGKIMIVDSLGNVNPQPFLDLTGIVSSSGSERGLLGLAFSPNYKSDRCFWVDYTKSGSGAKQVSRFYCSNSNPDSADPTEYPVISYTDPFSNHNGGCIKFGPDGYLYLGWGDGGSAGDPGDRAQDSTSLWGKMLRIDVVGITDTYRIPPTNPWISNPNWNPEIWSYGHRNPWRFSFDRETGDLWMGDVGQNLWEEVNFEASGDGGRNYGWRCREGMHDYDPSNCSSVGMYTEPVAEYPHGASSGCSITGGFRYKGILMQQFRGYYLFVDYCSGRFRTIDYDDISTFTMLNNLAGDMYNYSSFGEDKYGELYVCGLSDGVVYRIQIADPVPYAVLSSPDSIEKCSDSTFLVSAAYHPDLLYQWYNSSGLISGANSSDYMGSSPSEYYCVVSNGSGASDTTENVYVTDKDCSSDLRDAVSEVTFSLRPNPASDLLFLDLTDPEQSASYIIYHISGAILIQGKVTGTAINISHLESGMYLVELKQEGRSYNQRFIKF